jgi:hypothetical protein
MSIREPAASNAIRPPTKSSIPNPGHARLTHKEEACVRRDAQRAIELYEGK